MMDDGGEKRQARWVREKGRKGPLNDGVAEERAIAIAITIQRVGAITDQAGDGDEDVDVDVMALAGASQSSQSASFVRLDYGHGRAHRPRPSAQRCDAMRCVSVCVVGVGITLPPGNTRITDH
jgi:hypothetical protein